MALPTPTDLKTMNYGYQGQPFVDVPAKDSIDLSTMDYSYLAQPFVGNPSSGEPPATTVVKDIISMGIIAYPR